LIDDLPLFSVAPTPPPQPAKVSNVEAALADILPDEVPPREALDVLFSLKEAAKD